MDKSNKSPKSYQHHQTVDISKLNDRHTLFQVTLIVRFHLKLSNKITISNYCPDSKVHGVNMGPTWVLSAPDGPHVGPMNLAIRVVACHRMPALDGGHSSEINARIYRTVDWHFMQYFVFVRRVVGRLIATSYRKVSTPRGDGLKSSCWFGPVCEIQHAVAHKFSTAPGSTLTWFGVTRTSGRGRFR